LFPSTGTNLLLFLAAFASLAPSTAQAVDCPADCPCEEQVAKLLEAGSLPVRVDEKLLRRQYDVLQGMTLESVQYSPQGPIKRIKGETGLVLPAYVTQLKEGDAADFILPILRDVLLANGSESLVVHQVREQGRFEKGLLLKESIGGIRVIGSLVAIKFDPKSMRVSYVGARFVPDRELVLTPEITSTEAEKQVPGEIMQPSYLGIYVKCCGPTRPRLVWVVSSWTYRMSEVFYVDALTGVLVDRAETSVIESPT
jgi:hypothetical protein